ncbi:MAG: hypothetical protein Ct9H300mP19_13620 [Dehalococcoidia bacterium]|nr:MAG: hypothetical protein Ct9H300mP19_13620 [Dehalococcoidia bacterium]
MLAISCHRSRSGKPGNHGCSKVHTRVPEVKGMKPKEERKNLHNDPDFAKKSLFGTTANAGVMTMAYVNQMIEACFPAESFYNGGTLTYKGINPFRDGDVVVFFRRGRR